MVDAKTCERCGRPSGLLGPWECRRGIGPASATAERECNIATAAREAGREEERARVVALEAALRDAQAAIERDRTGLAAALAEVVELVRTRSWLLEGRGPYGWDDDRYRMEAGVAMRKAARVALEALHASGKLADAEHRRAEVALAARGDEPNLADRGEHVKEKSDG